MPCRSLKVQLTGFAPWVAVQMPEWCKLSFDFTSAVHTGSSEHTMTDASFDAAVLRAGLVVRAPLRRLLQQLWATT
jgi:hypothetical protein